MFYSPLWPQYLVQRLTRKFLIYVDWLEGSSSSIKYLCQMTTANLSNIIYCHGSEATCPELVLLTMFLSMNKGMSKLFLKVFYSSNLFKKNKAIISFLYNKYKNSSRWKEFSDFNLNNYYFYLLFCLFSLSRLFLLGTWQRNLLKFFQSDLVFIKISLTDNSRPVWS